MEDEGLLSYRPFRGSLANRPEHELKGCARIPQPNATPNPSLERTSTGWPLNSNVSRIDKSGSGDTEDTNGGCNSSLSERQAGVWQDNASAQDRAGVRRGSDMRGRLAIPALSW